MSRTPRSPLIKILLIIIALLAAADITVISLCFKAPGGTKPDKKPSASQSDPTAEDTEAPTEAAPELLSTATVLSTGDVLSTYIYRISLGGGTSFELSTAINLVLQVLGLIVVLITNKFVSKLDIMGIF